ncbi:hypothetical protein ACXHPE_12705, partial [Vibrio cincinnatiensis]
MYVANYLLQRLLCHCLVLRTIFNETQTSGVKNNLITTNFKLTKESIMAILFTKEEAMKDLP